MLDIILKNLTQRFPRVFSSNAMITDTWTQFEPWTIKTTFIYVEM